MKTRVTSDKAGRRRKAPLTKEKGVWVFRAGEPLSASATDAVLKSIRKERDRKNMGGK